MKKILTDTDWQEMWAESEQKGTVSGQSKGVETISQGKILYVCNTYNYWTELRNGLSISIYE
ncbi:hypothetical protein PQG02_06545 [Nostoc sp. UHCC 0926]|uniref:hypothetical protein n=1 Tax=unclassified Nostoc TaxID=2593658 RepID=UPI00236257CB|nr:hypothetical protein [Nostoc sp. UHCC 0926]WDD34008.1 hypothetical protein PQG02_06545 [Nostoc sp. UHCC 0926]